MKKVVLTLFVIFMIAFLILEIVTVIDLLNDKQPPLMWIENEY